MTLSLVHLSVKLFRKNQHNIDFVYKVALFDFHHWSHPNQYYLEQLDRKIIRDEVIEHFYTNRKAADLLLALEWSRGNWSVQWEELKNSSWLRLGFQIKWSLLTILHFDLLSFWADRQKTFPILSKIVRIVHCIPASSAEIERTWSAAGLILTSQRSRMNVKNFKHTVLFDFVSNNKDW